MENLYSFLSEFSKNYLINDYYCDITESTNNEGVKAVKENTYYLFDDGKRIAYSYKLERVLNKTVNTKDGKIYYNNVLVWVQNPNKH